MARFSLKSKCPRCLKRDNCIAFRRIQRAERYLYMACGTAPLIGSVAMVTFECDTFLKQATTLRTDPDQTEVTPEHYTA